MVNIILEVIYMNELLIFVLATTLLIPIIMLVFGAIFSKKAPKSINHIYGYRTPRSMKNQNTWEFANMYCGRLWLKMGIFMLLISLVVVIVSLKRGEKVVLCCTSILIALQTIIVILSIFPVERALKEKFDENGEPRS